VLALRENAGMAAHLSTMAAALPDALIVCDMPLANVCGPLGLAWQRSIVVADASNASVHAAIGEWMDAKAKMGKPAWILHAPALSMAGARVQDVGHWRFARTFVAPTVHPPARDTASESLDAELARVDGLDPSVVATRFGNTPVWGIVDRGFYASAIAPFGTVRMTNGSASLDLPATLLANCDALSFDWFSWAPQNERRSTQVRIAGRDAWQADLPPGLSSSVVALPAGPLPDVVRVEIRSATFDPRSLDPADSRPRVGIGVVGIRAIAKAPAVQHAGALP
jgi:hypothetical protein